jgi:hypothetical protein
VGRAFGQRDAAGEPEQAGWAVVVFHGDGYGARQSTQCDGKPSSASPTIASNRSGATSTMQSLSGRTARGWISPVPRSPAELATYRRQIRALGSSLHADYERAAATLRSAVILLGGMTV